MQPSSNLRRIKLVAPRLQLRMIGVFLLLSITGMGIQIFLLGVDLRLLAQMLPPGNALQREMMGVLGRAFLFSMGMWVPLTLGVGILVTHRIAGPIYRFQRYLEAVARGEVAGPCRIRQGDELQDLCDSINAAVRGLDQGVESAPPRRRAG